MKQKYRLYRRGARGRYYAQDRISKRQESLGTCEKTEVTRLLNAKNESEYQPAFNAHMARTYLALIQQGTVSTNSYLRRLHSFALQLGWIPCPCWR